jgi:hypothetical protein
LPMKAYEQVTEAAGQLERDVIETSLARDRVRDKLSEPARQLQWAAVDPGEPLERR